MTNKIFLLALFSFLIMVSCKDDSKDSGGTFPDNIQGVWQEEGWDDGDELGVYFSSKEMGYWDYFGDEYDDLEHCYSNYVLGELVSRDGDNYRIKASAEWVQEGEDDEGIITIKVEDDMLTMSYPEDDGDYEELYSRDSRSVSSMTPECSFAFKANPESKSDKILSLFN